MFFFIALSFTPLLFLKEAEYPDEARPHPKGERFVDLVKTAAGDARLVRYFVCRSFLGMALIAAPQFFAMRAIEVLGKEQAAGLMLTLAAAATLARSPCSLVVGPLGDRFGFRIVMALGAAATGLGVVSALVAGSEAGFYAAFMFATFGQMAFWAGHGNYILEIAPLEKRPSYIGLDNMSGLPFVVMPFVGGWMADRLGYAPPFVMAAVFSAIATVLFVTYAADSRSTMRKDIVA
jgi:MFS family permease